MRNDIAKVLVERPRLGGNRQGIRVDRRRSKEALKNIDNLDDWYESDYVTHRGIKSVHYVTSPKANEKHLNENLSPLWRFLIRNRGRAWDEVYHDIMENLNMNNAVQYHVWQHLVKFDMVRTPVVMLNGVPHVRAILGRWTPLNEATDLYVHPETKTLEGCTSGNVNKNYRFPAPKINELRQDENDPLTFYLQEGKLWFKYVCREPTKSEEFMQMFSRYEFSPASYLPDSSPYTALKRDHAGNYHNVMTGLPAAFYPLLGTQNAWDEPLAVAGAYRHRYKVDHPALEHRIWNIPTWNKEDPHYQINCDKKEYLLARSLWENMRFVFRRPLLPIKRSQVGGRLLAKLRRRTG